MVVKLLFAAALESIPFTLSFLILFIWMYSFIFNHNLVQTYSNKIRIHKSQINEHIRKNINEKYQIQLIEVNVEEEDDDDYNDLDKPAINSSTEVDIRNKITGVIFSLTISLSIELIILMMCELVNYSNEDLRLVFFKVVIDTLILLITVIQPFMLISLLINEDLVPTKKNSSKLIMTGILSVSWFFILHKFGNLSRSFSPDQSNINTRSLIERKINEISITGITVLAILSGIGSTSTPYKLFSIKSIVGKLSNKYSYTTSKKEINESNLNTLIQSFNNTSSLLTKRKQELNRLLVANSSTIYNQPNYSFDNVLYNKGGLSSSKKNKLGDIFHKVQSFASLSSLSVMKEKSEEKELTDEINSLNSLRNTIYEDLNKLLSKYIIQKEESVNSNKILYQILNWSNTMFGIYCIYRIMNVFFIRLPFQLFKTNEIYELHSTTNVIIEKTYEGEVSSNSKDALAITLSKLILSFFNLPLSETQLINQISFILSGSLFICSFSNVLMTFKSFSKFFPSFNKISKTSKNWLKHLIASELLGIYVISTALLIRTNLPSNLSNQISKILSLSGSAVTNATIATKEVEFVDNWFDKIFAISCIATFLLLLLKKFIDDHILDESYDEEMLIEGAQSSYKTA